MSKLFLDFFNFQAIVDKTNVMLLQSMLISERLTQRETEFSTKESTVATLPHGIGGKVAIGNIKVDFFVLH